MQSPIAARESLRVLIEPPRAALAELQRTWQRVRSVPHAIRLARDTQVGTTPHDVVLAHKHWKLLRYRRETPALYREPVLFCYALVNRSYILDLQPDKSVVRKYLEQGFDVYMIDWSVPGPDDHGLHIQDYVEDFLTEAIDFVLEAHKLENLHLLGYCMGGTFATMYAALNPPRVRSLTLLASPLDFSAKESLLNFWVDPLVFDVDAFVDAYGNCPADFLQNCFLYIKPIQNLIEKKLGLYEQLCDTTYVTNYFALERWVGDNVPVAGETFREFVKSLYQQNELTQNKFKLGARRVDLAQITCPLLLLTAKKDHLVPPSSTLGLRPHVRSQDVKSVTIEAGHVGLVVSSKVQRTLWPEATRWLASRSVAAA